MFQKWSICFLTYTDDGSPGQTTGLSGDRALLRELCKRGCHVTWNIWDDPDVDWARYDLVLVKRTWDVCTVSKHEKFVAWVEKLESLGVKLMNRPHVLKWSVNKLHLEDLRKNGAPVMDTVFISKAETKALQLTSIMQQRVWPEIMIKPSIGTNGYRSFKVSGAAEAVAKQGDFEAMVEEEVGVLVQRFIPTVQANGEWSLVFFNGIYSHALHMKPRKDFHRGLCEGQDIVATDPPKEALKAALCVMKALPWQQPPSCARIDVVEDGCDGSYKLMEIESIDPVIYLELYPKAIQTFADMVMDDLD